MCATSRRTTTIANGRVKLCMMEAGNEESPFCIYSTKLLHFYTIVCSRALHKLLQQEIDKQNVSDFVSFLNMKSETLFHLRGITCCCGIKEEYGVLGKAQWNNLFTRSSIQCPRNQRNCFHTYKARQFLTVDKLDFSLACVLLRSLCNPIYEYRITTLQLNRNKFIHDSPPPLDPNQFELLWRKGKTALCNVTNDLHEEIKQDLCKEADMIYNYREMLTRYLEITKCEVTEHIKENLFSQINVLDMVVHTLEQHGIAIIVGYPGSGKSYLGKEVMRIMHSKDQIVLKIDKVKLWNELVNPRLGYVVFIDDFLGESNLNTSKLTKLKDYFNTIYACVKNTRTKVVLTVRKSIYERWRNQLEETSSKLFERDFIIDLTKTEYQLSNDEKKSILMKHLQKADIQLVHTKKEAKETSNLVIDQFTVDAISCTTPFNFPLLCFLFSRSRNIRLGQKFFQHPRDTLLKTIDEMRKSQVSKEKKKYAVMLYCAISGKNVSLRKLDTTCMTLICDSLELSDFKQGNAVKVMVRDAIEDLKDEYFREIGKETYEFVHQSFLEATILSCGEVFPELLIEHCSSNTLFELIRTENYEDGEGELVLKLDEEYYDNLITRFMNEIKTFIKLIPHVLLHPVMEDSGFYQQFLNSLVTFTSAKETPLEVVYSCLIESSRLGQIGGVMACLSSKIPQHVFETALHHASYNNRAEIVVCLAVACPAVKFDPYFLQACSFGCKNVVWGMLSTGIIQNVSLIQEGIVRATKANHINLSRGLIELYNSKTDVHTFKKTMLKIIVDAIETSKNETVREILSERIHDLKREDMATLFMESCFSNQLDLAYFLLINYFDPTDDDLNYYIKRFLAGNIWSINMVFGMKNHFKLQQFFTKENIDYILTSTGFGSFVIERALGCFPDHIKSVCSSPDMIKHMLWIGCHSVVSKLCQRNQELTLSLQKMEQFVNKYNFVEFAAFCGFPDIDMIAHDCLNERVSLFGHCIEGYKRGGRIPGFEVELGYLNSRKAVNFFETSSRQRGYASCLKKLYNEAIELTNDSPTIKNITKILCETFESDTFETIGDFLNFRSIDTQRLFPISSDKMDVLQLLRHILLHHVDLMEVQGVFDSFA